MAFTVVTNANEPPPQSTACRYPTTSTYGSLYQTENPGCMLLRMAKNTLIKDVREVYHFLFSASLLSSLCRLLENYDIARKMLNGIDKQKHWKKSKTRIDRT